MDDNIETQIIPPDEAPVEQNQNDDGNNPKIYKRRWLILAAVFAITFVNGTQKAFLPISDIFINQLGIGKDEFRYLNQIPIFMSLLTVVPLSRALHHYGLRKMAHLYCILIIVAHSIKASCCFDRDPVIDIPKQYRFTFFVIAELITGIAIGMSTTFPAKVAYDWFPVKETTRALILGHIGFSLAAGLSNFTVPLIVTNINEISRISYLFEASAITVTIIVFFTVNISRPLTPPSDRAVMSSRANVSIKDGLWVLLTNPHFILLLIEFSINASSIASLQVVLEEILRSNGYSNQFCGTVISQSFILGIIFGLLSATWVDKSSDYVTICRIASLLFATGFTTFCISLNFSDIRSVILVANTFASFGSSLLMPSVIQTTFRCASGILPEATISAISILLTQSLIVLLIYLEGPLQRSKLSEKYIVLLAFFGSIILLFNILFAFKFKEPDREQLKQKLSARVPDILNNEPE